MEIYVIDENGNMKEHFANVLKDNGIGIENGIMRIAYKKFQLTKEEKEERIDVKINPWLKGDFMGPNYEVFNKEIDLTKEKRVHILFP